MRAILSPPNPPLPGVGTARTPLHLLDGMITPSGLHFERSHSGIPDIDPDQHRLVIHGLVRRPLVFTLEALHRYPMQSRVALIECAGNSGALNAPPPQPLDIAPFAASSAVRASGNPFMFASVSGIPVPSSILPENATNVLMSV